MSADVWFGLFVYGWFAISITVALLLGKVISNRDRGDN